MADLGKSDLAAAHSIGKKAAETFMLNYANAKQAISASTGPACACERCGGKSLLEYALAQLDSQQFKAEFLGTCIAMSMIQDPAGTFTMALYPESRIHWEAIMGEAFVHMVSVVKSTLVASGEVS